MKWAIFNSCKLSLNQQHYTWRHDNTLKYIFENFDSEKYQLKADFDGYSIPEGATISPDICFTRVTPELPERPVIVIIVALF